MMMRMNVMMIMNEDDGGGNGWIDIMHGFLSIYSCNAW